MWPRNIDGNHDADIQTAETAAQAYCVLPAVLSLSPSSYARVSVVPLGTDVKGFLETFSS